METHTYHYRISYKEWLTGVRWARRRNPRWMLRYVAGWLIPVALMYLDLAVIWGAFHGESAWSDAIDTSLVMIVLLGAIIGYRVFRMRRIYRRSLMARYEPGLALAFNEEYFVSGLPGRSEGRFLWHALYDFVENDVIALLYTSKNRFIVIPKHAMSETSWAMFRALVPHRKAPS